jgi:hypothetical protein
MNIFSVFKKIFCVFLSFLLVFSQLAYATPGKNIIKTSKKIKQEYDKKNIVFTKKAKNGVKVKIIENPKEKEAGDGGILAIILISALLAAGAEFTGQMVHQSNERRKGRDYQMDMNEIVKAGVVGGVEGLVGEVVEGADVIVEAGVNVYENKGDPIKSTIDTLQGIINVSPLGKYGQDAAEMVWDSITTNLPLLYKGLWDLQGDVNNYIREYIRDSGFSPYGLLMWDFLTHDYGSMYKDFQLTLNNNPIESSPQTVTFSETFSGYCSAVADYPGANSSNITFSNLEGKRTGVLSFNLIQTMSGRFQGYEGVYANTFYNVPINGEISGEAVYMHNRPVVAQAQLILSGILDFKSAVGPFTINPDGTSFGTFKGHTFDFFDPNRTTGDVTLYYRAYPVGFGGGGGGGGAR